MNFITPTIKKKTLLENIALLARRRGIDYNEVCKRCGIRSRSLRNRLPTLPEAVLLAACLGVTIDALVAGVDLDEFKTVKEIGRKAYEESRTD